MTTATQDRDYKKALAASLFDAMRKGVDTDCPSGTVSGQVVECGDLHMTLRVRVDHGDGRGHKYHFYRIALSEVSK